MKQPKRYYLEHDQFRFMRLWLQHREIYFISGTNSLTVPSRQEKYIQYNRPDGSKVCRLWPDENGEMIELTPGEAARAELRRTFPGLRRVGWMAEHIRLFDWRWPMLYTGPSSGYGAYIDLKGAYHQLYSRLWLDTAFPCGYGQLSLMVIADRLKEWKSARNSLIGVTAGRRVIGVKGYKSIPLSTSNPYLAPGLWATIQAILNELAYEAKRLGAIYIATDGYIFPDLLQAQHFEELLYDSGLKYRKGVGNYEIKAWGSYSVQGKKTETFDRPNIVGGLPFEAIRLFDQRQPQRIIRWWAHSIPHYSKQKYSIGGIKQWEMV